MTPNFHYKTAEEGKNFYTSSSDKKPDDKDSFSLVDDDEENFC